MLHNSNMGLYFYFIGENLGVSLCLGAFVVKNG